MNFIPNIGTDKFEPTVYSMIRLLLKKPLDQGHLIRVNTVCYIISSFHGPVVQSIVSLTSSLRGQLIKCFTTL